jgi:beta-mannanase
LIVFTRRQLLVSGLAAGIASIAGCSSDPKMAGNGRPPREFGIASDPWKAADWAQAVGAKPTMVMEFEAWERNRGLDTHFQAARDQGMKAYSITWEPWATVDATLGNVASSAVQPAYSNQAIASGHLDPYIRTLATSVKNSKLTVYIRYAHEMNGPWYPWHNDPDSYVKAWRHIVEQFRAVGATDAKFIFAPSEDLYETDDAVWLAKIQQYWPGQEYVDYVGVTMINLGKKKSYTVQQFVPRLTLMHKTYNKDAILAEINSAADGRIKFFTDLRTWLGTPDADWVRGVVLSQLPSRGQAAMGDAIGDLSWQVADDPGTKPVIKALVQDIT